MNDKTVIIVALSVVAGSTTTAIAASPDKWTELMQRASAACMRASELKGAKSSAPVDFTDKVLVMVDGVWPQPHMKNAPARFACLYDKRAQTAEANEAAR
ncbi:MAG: hypothetical protein ACM3L9_09060 [Deltaproteobacteria bacterium]